MIDCLFGVQINENKEGEIEEAENGCANDPTSVQDDKLAKDD